MTTRKSNTAPKSNARANKKADTMTLEQVRTIFNAEGFDIAVSKAVSGKFDVFNGVGRGRKKTETIDNLATAENWIKEKIAEKAIATMPPESAESTESTESEQVTDIAPTSDTQEAVTEQTEEVAPVQETAPAAETQEAVTETTETIAAPSAPDSDEDTPAIFYTTASPELDIADATSFEWTDKKTAGVGTTARRWRKIETVKPVSQKDAYKAAKFPIKTQAEWNAIAGLQIDIDHTVDQFSDTGEFLGKVQKSAKKARESAPSTKEFWGAKNAPAKSVKAGSKIDIIIKMLSAEGGATVQALSDAVGKQMTPSYIAQRLALRNYGMRRIEGSNNYAIVRPEV